MNCWFWFSSRSWICWFIHCCYIFPCETHWLATVDVSWARTFLVIVLNTLHCIRGFIPWKKIKKLYHFCVSVSFNEHHIKFRGHVVQISFFIIWIMFIVTRWWQACQNWNQWNIRFTFFSSPFTQTSFFWSTACIVELTWPATPLQLWLCIYIHLINNNSACILWVCCLIVRFYIFDPTDKRHACYSECTFEWWQ